MKAILTMPDGDMRVVSPENGRTFSLEELQAMVGGHIEVCPSAHIEGLIAVVDDDGVLKGCEYNASASAVIGYRLCGNAILCDTDMVE